jgi:hypothetical protein
MKDGRQVALRIVTRDEIWARSYEPHLKRQSKKWKHPGSPRPKKVRPTQSNVKAMFIVAYDIDGVILHHTVPQRQTVNAAYYCNFLRTEQPILFGQCPSLSAHESESMLRTYFVCRDNIRRLAACEVGSCSPTAG